MQVMPPDVPYEKQVDEWTCGAASLCMVYQTFGLPGTQEEVWPRISTPDPWGQMRGRTHRLAADALRRGLSAVIVQAGDPWKALLACDRRGVRVIFNQQLSPGSTRRHFSVLVRAGDEHAIVHDPYSGPSIRWAKKDFLYLWGPSPRDPGVVGNLLIAFSDAEPASTTCDECGRTMTGALDCPGCGKSISLSPSAPITCIEPGCPSAIWRRIFCPSCDAVIMHPDAGAAARAGDVNMEHDDMSGPDDLKRIAGAFDRYSAMLSETERSAPPGPALDQFRDLVGQMKGMYGQFFEEYRKLDGEPDAKIKSAQERIQAARDQAAKVAVSPPKEVLPRPKPRNPPKEIDPLLGEKLRDKLLEEFGLRGEPAPRPGPVDYGSLLDYEPEG